VENRELLEENRKLLKQNAKLIHSLTLLKKENEGLVSMLSDIMEICHKRIYKDEKPK